MPAAFDPRIRPALASQLPKSSNSRSGPATESDVSRDHERQPDAASASGSAGPRALAPALSLELRFALVGADFAAVLGRRLHRFLTSLHSLCRIGNAFWLGRAARYRRDDASAVASSWSRVTKSAPSCC